MKFQRLWVTVTVACATYLFVSGVSAQDGEPTGVVEIFACNFVGDSDMGDLLGVAETFNEWADDNGVTDYGAVLLTPHLYSDQITFDVGWVGISPNAAAEGAGLDQWIASGQDVQADFDEVIECPSHTQYAVVNINTPAESDGEDGEEDNGPGLVAFSDCALHDGRIVPDAIAAHEQWSEYLAEHGSDNFSAFLFGLAGLRDDINFNFKAVRAFPNAQAYGQYLDVITAGGFMRAGELFDRVHDCDSPRVYVTNQIREANPEE